MKRYHPFIRTALASLVATTFGTLFAGVRTYQTFGPNATVLSGAIGLFRSDIGGGNNGVSTNETVFAGGRREINWDAAALPELMPADFFNRVSRRGAVFQTPGGSFRVSANNTEGQNRLFGNINASYPTQFTTNSPNRLFTPWGSTITEITFFVPGQPQTPATVDAFGAVFTDVEEQGSTRIEAYDVNGVFMGSVDTPVSGNAGLSFAGLRFDAGERIGMIRITSGGQIPAGHLGDEPGKDLVVMDDFIYSEPQHTGGATSIGFGQMSDLRPIVNQFRSTLGANNGVSTNNAVFSAGRREINWDAAALPVDMPVDFFNTRSRRGAVFSTPGTGFRVSLNTNAGPARLFGDIRPDYAGQFSLFSSNRLFTTAGSTEVKATFFVPGQPEVPATIDAFGVVFADVDKAGSTRVEALGLQQNLLVSATAAPAPGGGSFVALRAPTGERIASIRIISGNQAPGADVADEGDVDVVVMDDFIYSEPQAAALVMTATGTNAEGIRAGVDAFRQALGANNGVSTNDAVLGSGRREINWDAAALPVDMPADFFNSRSRRGALFSTPGTGFQVSVNSADAPERRFGNLNPAYVEHFNTNSPNRLFAAAGSTVVNTTFFVPGLPSVPAESSGFGVIFTGVQVEGSAFIELFDAANRRLGRFVAPVSEPGGLSFVGVKLPDGLRAARVRITSGSLALSATAVDSNGLDVVAMDDFIYGEPVAMPLTLNPLARQANGALQVTLQGVAGIPYRVESTPDLANWVELGAATSPAGVLDTNGPTLGARMYRAVIR